MKWVSLQEASEAEEELKVQGTYCLPKVRRVGMECVTLCNKEPGTYSFVLSFHYVCCPSCLLRTVSGSIKFSYCNLKLYARTISNCVDNFWSRRTSHYEIIYNASIFPSWVRPSIKFVSPSRENRVKVKTNYRKHLRQSWISRIDMSKCKRLRPIQDKWVGGRGRVEVRCIVQ